MQKSTRFFLLCTALGCLAVFAGNDKQQANGYDNAWEDGWVQHCRAIYNAGTGKTAGFVLQIGDSISHSNPYSQWPRYGAGKTAEDTALSTWAQCASMGTGNSDTSNKNGFYLAIADTATRGMTAASGISTAEFLSGSGNGSTAMPSDTNTATAKVKIGDGQYTNDIHINTLAAAFADARYAVVMLGTNDANAGRSASAFIADLTAITDTLEARKIVVILSTIPPMTTAGSANVDVYNTAIRTFAQSRGLPVIDYCAEVLARKPGTSWQNTLISSDGVHPSASGGGYDASSSPYVDGGDAATHKTGPSCDNVGYLLRSWLTIQKLKEVKSYVGDGVNPPPGGPAIASIAVAPVNSNLAAGSTQAFTAVANDSGGNAIAPQPSFTWSVSGGGTISASGVLTAATTPGGPHTVTALAGGKSGTAAFMIVAGTAVGSITVTPASPAVPAGGTQTFAAQAKDDFGNVLATQPAFTWSVSGGGSVSASGVLQAGTVAGGPFTVTASASGKSGNGAFTVAALSAIESVLVSPGSASVFINATQPFTASAKDVHGNAVASQPVFSWSVSSGGGAVTSSGLYTAGGVTGSATVTASAAGKSGSAAVSVSAKNRGPLMVSMPTADPNPATTGATVQFTAAATDADNDALTYAWDFGDSTAAAGATASRVYTAAGDYLVSATATDTSGAAVTNTFVLKVQAGSGGGSGGGGGSGSTTGGSVLPLNVTKLSGSFRFSGLKDSCTVSGVLQNMPAGFSLPGLTADAHVGGASVSFVFDARGKGRSAQGSLTLTVKAKRDRLTKKSVFAGGDVPYSLRLSKGSWASAWGIDPAASLNGALTLDVGIRVGDRSYGAPVISSVTSTPSKGGKFKK